MPQDSGLGHQEAGHPGDERHWPLRRLPLGSFLSSGLPPSLLHGKPGDDDTEGLEGLAPATIKATAGQGVRGRVLNLGQPECGGGRGAVRLEGGLPAEGLALGSSCRSIYARGEARLDLHVGDPLCEQQGRRTWTEQLAELYEGVRTGRQKDWLGPGGPGSFPGDPEGQGAQGRDVSS